MDELEVARKYGLFIRRASVFFEDGSEIDSSYLYSCVNCREPFDEISRKLEQINDYCFHQLVAAEKQFAYTLRKYVQADDSELSDAAEVDVMAEDLDISNENLKSVALATPVILVASFLEWALKEVYRRMRGKEPPKQIGGKKHRKLSDVEHLLDLLKNECGLCFAGASAAPPVLGSARKIRNKYVHGEWADLGDALEDMSLRDFFDSVSSLLKVIDQAHELTVSGIKG